MRSDVAQAVEATEKQSSRAEKFPWTFFTIAYGFSWLFWLPGVLATRGLFELPIPATVLVILGAHGPLIAAFSLTYRETGRAGIKELVRQGFNLRLAPGWILVILGLPVILAGLAWAMSVATGGPRTELTLLAQPLLILPTFLILFFVGGSIQEEFGWRGYALPRLLLKWSALTASMVLGVLWGLWHLPLFYTAGVSQAYMPLWAFLILAIAFSILFTWFYINTNNNLLSALLFHTAINTSLSLFPPIQQSVNGDQRAFVLLMVLYVIVAVSIIVKGRHRWLKRSIEI